MRVLVCSMAMLTAASAFAGKLDLADLKDWRIVVPVHAIPSERYGAEEFQRLFNACLNINLPIGEGTAGQDRTIFIGPSDDGLGEEDLRICIRKNAVTITGGRPRGALYGVYEFFERYLGVRFLTHDHTHTPRQAGSVKVPCETYSYRPPFSFRNCYYYMNIVSPDFAARLRNNVVTYDEKLGGRTPQKLINHSHRDLVPVSKYGEEHPEYFALVNGKRLLHGDGGPQLCVTNPDVIRIVTERVLEAVRANPDLGNISVSQNDNYAYCRCPRCEEINTREGTAMGANLALVNAVADAVAAEFPNVKVGTLSYQYTRQCPRYMKPRDNVQIQLCSIECATLFPLSTRWVKKNRAFVKDMKDWAKVCDDIWIWNYNTNFHAYDLPFPNLRAIGPNVRFCLHNNVRGVFMQANGKSEAGEMCDLRNYVISRCLWNPSLDGWRLVEGFCRLHYGQAANVMLEYLTFIHDHAEFNRIQARCYGGAADFGITRDVAMEIREYFQRAMALAESEVVRGRVEKASITAYRSLLETAGEIHYEDGSLRKLYPRDCEEVFDTYVSLCSKYKVTMASENGTLEEYLARLRADRAGLPAVRIENDVWRVTLFPAQGGKVIDMLYKPTGRNLLSALERHTLDVGTFEEWGERGHDHRGPVEAAANGDSVTLTRTLDDGSTIVRTLTLCPDDTGAVRCATTITHRGEEPKEYQTKVHPEFHTATTKKDTSIIAVYIRDDDGWKQFNQNWGIYDGPNAGLLRTAAGGAYAYFNHEARFGVRVTYDPAQYAEPRLWWNSDRELVNLELMTRAVKLKHDESFSYAYEFEYLGRPPGTV